MRTTININDATLAALKERAGASKQSLRQVVEETLQLGLASKPQGRGMPVEIPTYPVGIKSAYRGMSMNQLYDQVEAEDHLNVAEK